MRCIAVASILDSVPGDYDRNGVVESADFGRWKADYGSTVARPGFGSDGNFKGVVDASDYAVWRENLGLSFPGAGLARNVPKPSVSFLTALANLLIAPSRRRRRSCSS